VSPDDDGMGADGIGPITEAVITHKLLSRDDDGPMHKQQ